MRRVPFALLLALFASCAETDDAPNNAPASAALAEAGRTNTGGNPGTAAIRRFQSPEKALAAFRAGLNAPDSLRGGAPTRDALIARFMQAVEGADTTAIRAMVLDRAEFAYLYYPTSPYTKSPTVQEAPLAWFLLVQNSQIGITRVFNRMAGSPEQYAGHRCDPEPSMEGANRFWRACVVDLRTDRGELETRRLFGSIIEREGRFKFFSYANDF
jgi:hypothetical protein